MKIALIRPPKISGAFEKILIQEPINLAYLAAYLKQNGIQSCIWDFEVEPFSETLLRQKMEKERITAAGITAMTPTINNAHSIAETIKKISPETMIIAGGPHISALPEESLKEFPCFDYAVIGEGEVPLLSLCRQSGPSKKIIPPAGTAWRENGRIRVNSPEEPVIDLDTLPFPEREKLPAGMYKHLYAAGIDKPSSRSTVVFTSRGCSQNCTFCAVKKTSGSRVRFRSAENVRDELIECKEKFGYNHITFEDTNFTLDKKRFLKICGSLKELGLTWDCQTKVSLIDEKMISIMKDSGCLKIAYGVESGSQKILDLMKKDITISQVRNAFSLTRKAGIVACAFFILGSHPEENREDIQLTERLLMEIKPDVFQLGIICPYPGTAIYDIMKQEGILKDLDWCKFNFMHSQPQWGTKYVTAQELISFQKMIYLRYMLSPHFIGNLLFKLSDPRKLPGLLRLSGSMIKYLFFEQRG